MSLFGSIQMAGNTLQAMQIGLHVVGNNIANANTPGYVREADLHAGAGPEDWQSDLGLGVEVAGSFRASTSSSKADCATPAAIGLAPKCRKRSTAIWN